MSRVEPVDPRVRLAITQWPPDAPRGSVTTFCAEHGISRETFYAIRRRAALEGPVAALEPRSRRPNYSPGKLTDDLAVQAVAVRAALEQSGLDHGPISVHEKMRALGMDPVPSTASLARIFRDHGVAKVEPRKKPRAAYRRFVYPQPNACWQLDATEYVLTGGRKCVIFQLIDDHSRLAVASHVAWGETSEGALTVVKKGITAHGVPQRLLSDNGAALNPSRRGVPRDQVRTRSRLRRTTGLRPRCRHVHPGLRPRRHPHHRAPPAQARNHLRQQPPTPRPQHRKHPTVRDVLTHEVSEMS